MTSAHDESVEAAVAACYRTWADNYYDNYYGEAAPYPPVHADLILECLRDAGVSTVLDVGCGPASFLRHIGDEPIAWHGFDLTPEMVEEAVRVADEMGRTDVQVWVGSVLDDAFTPPTTPVAFDAAVMIGVLPHVPEGEDVAVLRRMKDAVEPGGLLLAEARNALFGLFTLNRPTYDLFTTRLVDRRLLETHASDVERGALPGLDEALAARFRMDLPPRRQDGDRGAGYDDVLSRTHVPFELEAAAREAGWGDVELLYAHFHALPPMFERVVPETFRKASLAMEQPRDWRGTFMASTVLVSGRRPR